MPITNSNELLVDKETIKLLEEGKIAEWNVAVMILKEQYPDKQLVVQNARVSEINCIEKGVAIDISDMKFVACEFKRSALILKDESSTHGTSFHGCAFKYNVFHNTDLSCVSVFDIKGGRASTFDHNEFFNSVAITRGDERAVKDFMGDFNASILKKDDNKNLLYSLAAPDEQDPNKVKFYNGEKAEDKFIGPKTEEQVAAEAKKIALENKNKEKREPTKTQALELALNTNHLTKKQVNNLLDALEDIYDDKQKIAGKNSGKGGGGSDGINHNSFISAVTPCTFNGGCGPNR